MALEQPHDLRQELLDDARIDARPAGDRLGHPFKGRAGAHVLQHALQHGLSLIRRDADLGGDILQRLARAKAGDISAMSTREPYCSQAATPP